MLFLAVLLESPQQRDDKLSLEKWKCFKKKIGKKSSYSSGWFIVLQQGFAIMVLTCYSLRENKKDNYFTSSNDRMQRGKMQAI